MGKTRKDVLWVYFDHKLKLEFCRAKVISNAGLLPYRELGEAMQLTWAANERLMDNKRRRACDVNVSLRPPKRTNRTYKPPFLPRLGLSSPFPDANLPLRLGIRAEGVILMLK